MKRLLIALPLILFTITNCTDKQTLAKLELLEDQVAEEKQNKEIIKHWLCEGDKENFSIIDELIAEDCKVYYDGETHNREFVRSMMEGFPRFFSEGVHIVDDLIAEKDKVVARMTIRAKHTGEFLGVLPSGKELEYHAITIYRLEGGKIKEIWLEHTAVLDLKRQLGIEPTMKETE